ncbi:hypothetical protein COV23_00110 [Candidatus Wolfebacteria bacterium CG10_big_fil_rev_8_21_14_0_10_31_9]|uniref:Bacterial sugar transferase domain-containing protein n=1 Tax=Candidatus Wolfebacteria bacterium CG10_big_fil_rev_8_21_14_0_10_31_9 TaxID=1975070 RepID=A0A2H0REE4_9BACT|nr:MAG: hypothetical protein COV23_00110 [Candidatus Wolfebacteria bacterium CG10_big_fil_rev_8_21_14_0_10_31_9]
MAFSKIKTFVIFAGDILIFYVSLAVSLFIRRPFGDQNFENFFKMHLWPFTLVLLIWIFVFYLADLYNARSFKNNFSLIKIFAFSIVISTALSSIFFYLFPYPGVSPKTSLIIFAITFGILGFLWRYIFNYANTNAGFTENIIFIIPDKNSIDLNNTIAHIESNPQLGYKIINKIKEADISVKSFLSSPTAPQNNNLIVIPAHLLENEKITKIIYNSITTGAKAITFSNFYEMIFKKVPLSELNESWFVENIFQKHPIYDIIRRPIEFIISLVLIIILFPIFLILWILAKVASKGPAIYKHIRISKNKREFMFYKFRSMAKDHTPALLDQSTAKITPIGKLLRKTHFDELPQLFNILKGDLSFVGPRPDFIDYFNELNKQIPYYDIRTAITPGITGWAQVNYPITVSLEQTKERLSYDLFYLKNRSFLLDLVILIKTIRIIFTASGF